MATDSTSELAGHVVTPRIGAPVDDGPVAAVTARPAAQREDGHRSGPRVLVIRPSALGDICRTAPALATLRAAMPDAHIDFLIEDAFSEALRHHPALDGLILFPRRRFGRAWLSPSVAGELMQWARRLRGERYEVVIDLQGLARSGLVTWMTRARRRIGFAGARELAWLGYNRRHRIPDRIHHVDRMLSLLEAEGFPPVRDMRLYVAPDDEAWCADLLPGRFACIAPTSRWRSKCWPRDRFVEIARRLLAGGEAGDRIVLLSAPGERDYVEPMIREIDDPRVCFPETTVGRMLALIGRSSLLVCNDSAALHAAVAFDRPIVCVFGPTDPTRVGPYRRPDAVVQPSGGDVRGSLGEYRRQRDDQALISRVTVDEVWSRILEQVGRR